LNKKNLAQDSDEKSNEKLKEVGAALDTVQETADQWNDFQEEVVVDVSDLKITNLNTQEDENAASDADDDADTTSGDKSDKSVWHTGQEDRPTICDAVDEALESGQKVTAEVAAAAVAASGRWTSSINSSDMVASPLPRGAAGGGGGRRKKNAPDLKNEESFPTLGSKPTKKKTAKPKQDSGPAVYQPKRVAPRTGGSTASGGGFYQPPSSRGVTTGNRYGGLTDQGNRWWWVLRVLVALLWKLEREPNATFVRCDEFSNPLCSSESQWSVNIDGDAWKCDGDIAMYFFVSCYELTGMFLIRECTCVVLSMFSV